MMGNLFTRTGTADEVYFAYDYRAFGEQVCLVEPADKVTENFTGKEKDDEIELNYFGARYLDPMLELWISVDPARQFSSPYLYAQSPALVFLHEANHALGYLKNPDGFNARTLESDIEYDDQEEMRVIQGSETSAAKKLGEGVRYGHGGNSKIVDHSDER